MRIDNTIPFFKGMKRGKKNQREGGRKGEEGGRQSIRISILGREVCKHYKHKFL